MELFVNPINDEEFKLFQSNLALFKAQLLFESMDVLNYDEDVKNEILNTVIELLNDKYLDIFI